MKTLPTSNLPHRALDRRALVAVTSALIGACVGPHWQASDGSRVAGTVAASADAPVADAIPCLVLSTRDAGTSGSFSRLTANRRINTVGGTASPAGCGADTLGATARVPYTADHLFHTLR